MLRGTASVAVLVLAAFLAPALARAADSEGTEIHLSQIATRMMAPDRIRIDFRIEASGADARQIQAEVNRRMEAAQTKAKAVAAVKFETGGYTVFPGPYPQPAKVAPPRWGAVASFALTSADFGAALALAGDLQEMNCLMSNVQFSLAPETLAAAEDELTANALVALRRRADAVAKDLGVVVDHYKAIDVGNVGDQVVARPLLMRAQAGAMSSSAPPPVAEPGETTVSLSVNADIILAPAKN
ncbi:MAG TPA: SIMPL domain-containing protein [Stellaceae bacterium]|nr:SIMPL domain-containing protein [Stellaceae bacterium]